MRRSIRNQASSGRPSAEQGSLSRRASVEAAKIYASAGALYEKASRSDSVFGSPLGPIEGPTGRTFLPQFVYFGPSSSVDPVRIAVFSGLGGDDIKGSWSLIEWIGALLVNPDIGQGVSVSVFPVVNLLGIQGGAQRPRLQRSDWHGSQIPEIRLIAENARIRAYQGFIRIEASRDSVPSVVVRTALKRRAHHSPAEVYASNDFEPWDTRFET